MTNSTTATQWRGIPDGAESRFAPSFESERAATVYRDEMEQLGYRVAIQKRHALITYGEWEDQ